MYEKKFALIEGETFKLQELGKEIESIVGSKLEDDIGYTDRIVAQKPNPEQDFETFNIKFHLQDLPDFIDVVATADKRAQYEDYNFEEESFKVRLVSYHRAASPDDK